MKVKEMRLSRLQNMEHFQFADHVLTMCKEANIEKLNTALPPLSAAVDAEDKALNLPRKEEGTAELIRLDRVRDEAYRALQMLVGMNRHAEDEAAKKSAEKVEEVMERYPRVAQENYDKASGLVKNLVTDLNDGAMTAHITKIGAKPAITRLDAANTAFDKYYLARLKALPERGVVDLKKIRAAADKAVNAVLRRLDALAELEPETAGLAELVKQYNALADKKHDLLAHRKGVAARKSGTGKKPNEKPDKPDEKPGGGDGNGKTPGKPDEKPGNGGGKTPGGDKGSDGKGSNGGKTPDDGKGGKNDGKGKGGKKGGDDGNVSPEKALITPLLPALETELNLAHDCLAYGGVTDVQDGVTIYLVVNKRTQEEMYVKVEGGKLVVVQKKG